MFAKVNILKLKIIYFTVFNANMTFVDDVIIRLNRDRKIFNFNKIIINNNKSKN